MSSGAATAAAFVRREGLERVFDMVRTRYVARGEARGGVRIPEPTVAERRVLADLLGRKIMLGPITFTLEQLDAALQASTFACSLAELLDALEGAPVVTRLRQRKLRQESWDGWRWELEEALVQATEGTMARAWGQDYLHRLYHRYKGAPEANRQATRHAFALTLSALARLPRQPTERLAVFAAEVAGDPHAFDRDRQAGHFLATALIELSSDDTLGGRPSPAQRVPHTAESRAAVFEQYGLLVDTIWATVVAFNLARALTIEGTADPLVEGAGGRVLNLSSRQLMRWVAVEPAEARVYVVENPSVFETMVDRLEAAGRIGPGGPTLVCTAGYLSQPARRLLDLLVASGEQVNFWYSGDFDPDGLEIASAVLSRYPGRSRPWRLGVADYERAVKNGLPAPEGRLQGLERVAVSFPEVVLAMRQHHVWVYQEALVDQLIDDVFAPG